MEHHEQDNEQVFPEMRERAVRLVLDSEAARAIGSSGSPNGQHGSRWHAVLSISSKIGCAPQSLNDWVNKAEVNSGKRAGVTVSGARAPWFRLDVTSGISSCN
jgi:transposase